MSRDLPAGWASVASYWIDARASLFNHLKPLQQINKRSINTRVTVVNESVQCGVDFLQAHVFITVSCKVKHHDSGMTRFDGTATSQTHKRPDQQLFRSSVWQTNRENSFHRLGTCLGNKQWKMLTVQMLKRHLLFFLTLQCPVNDEISQVYEALCFIRLENNNTKHKSNT